MTAIGIVCYASVGGSGVVATELGHALAQRGHRVHLISSELPFRWRNGGPGLTFEQVHTPAYPLFREPQYLLALSNAIVRVACERELDVIHAHYAVPHATAAYLASQILAAEAGARRLRTVTTLHGTDITLVGSDASYRHVVAFSIEQSDAVTAVSESLRQDTIRTVGVRREIAVIPNFLDCAEYRRRDAASLRARLSPDGRPIVMHVSNFRPVKRLETVVRVFQRINATHPSRLVLLGDGPEREHADALAVELGIAPLVTFAGEQHDLVEWLSAADLFLLPSSQESFGMAALEAMACRVPVVASRIGGLPEVIEDGRTGFLCGKDDVEGMAERGRALLGDAALREAITAAAAATVSSRYCTDAIVPLYEAVYEQVLDSAVQ
jgi:N-acetyl-alpha-D-glucosaminyl L-malate synthase BshA